MTKLKTFQFALISLVTFTAPTIVWATSNSDYTEVSYDDLVNELSRKKDTADQAERAVNAGKAHLGIGYANSFSSISAAGKTFSRHTSGVQVSAGMDLGSPRFYTEGIFRNYGTNDSTTESFSLRELDMKLGYTNVIENIWNYSLATGLSTRFMKYTNSETHGSIDQVTPSLVISSGIFAQIHRNISIGAEISGRTAMINNAQDKDSFDFAFRINTSL
ncbi:MAG: hypothetical protein J7501_07580 [Bdellovibrio sp.]|nr:hypothetical protein [Bdellovibrio sp.]